MGSFDRDRVPPVFMDQGDDDYGTNLTYTERWFEWLDERPSRMTAARRADLDIGSPGLTDMSPDSDRRPEGSSLPPSGPTSRASERRTR